MWFADAVIEHSEVDPNVNAWRDIYLRRDSLIPANHASCEPICPAWSQYVVVCNGSSCACSIALSRGSFFERLHNRFAATRFAACANVA